MMAYTMLATLEVLAMLAMMTGVSIGVSEAPSRSVSEASLRSPGVPVATWRADAVAIDGDTIHVTSDIWYRQAMITDVRLRWIDAPEAKARARCPAEAALSVRVTARLQTMLDETKGIVALRDLRPDKYGGRWLAEVLGAGGINLATRLVQERLVVPYRGEGPKRDWCALGAP